MRKGGLSGSRASPSANTNLQTVKPSKRGSSQRLQGLDFCFCYVSFDPLESRKGDTSCRSRREDYSKIFRHRMVEVVRHKTEGDLPTGLVRMQGTSTPLCGQPSLHLHCSRQKGMRLLRRPPSVRRRRRPCPRQSPLVEHVMLDKRAQPHDEGWRGACSRSTRTTCQRPA